MRGHCCEAVREALTGARTGEVLSGESNAVRGADAVVASRRQQARVRHRKGLRHPASSLDPLHVRTPSCAGTGYLRHRPGRQFQGASGRPEAVADEETGRRSPDSLIIPAKPANKAGPPACGAGGGKQRDREKCGIAKHDPNAEPGSRVTGAGPHTWSCHQEQEGEAHSAPAPHHAVDVLRRVFFN